MDPGVQLMVSMLVVQLRVVSIFCTVHGAEMTEKQLDLLVCNISTAVWDLISTRGLLGRRIKAEVLLLLTSCMDDWLAVWTLTVII